MFNINSILLKESEIQLYFKEILDSHQFSDDLKESIKRELSPFSSWGKEILKKDTARLEELKKVKKMSINERIAYERRGYLNDEILIEKQRYMNDLENSAAFKNISPWLDDEAYIQFTIEKINRLLEYDYNEKKVKIEEGLKLLKTSPHDAARLFVQLGSCHSFWYIKRNIMMVNFDIRWFSPSELHPEIIYD